MASKALQMVIEIIKSRPQPGEVSIEEQRANMNASTGQFPLEPDVRCDPMDAGGVPAEFVSTPESEEGRVIYYLHGGGYVLAQ